MVIMAPMAAALCLIEVLSAINAPITGNEAELMKGRRNMPKMNNGPYGAKEIRIQENAIEKKLIKRILVLPNMSDRNPPMRMPNTPRKLAAPTKVAAKGASTINTLVI